MEGRMDECAVTVLKLMDETSIGHPRPKSFRVGIAAHNHRTRGFYT